MSINEKQKTKNNTIKQTNKKITTKKQKSNIILTYILKK